MNKKSVTLVAPLHWGLGHATRCIPIIKKEIADGNEVIIAANSGPKAILEEHFPQLRFIDIPFMEITYPKDGRMVWHFAKNGWKLLLSIWNEHRYLRQIIETENIRKVISDSRFGLWSTQIPCFFISHQIEIKTPLFQGLVNVLNRWVMNRYSEVWIPDYEASPGLGGTLSHPKKMPKRFKYIGPLSRFEHEQQDTSVKIWDSVAIISGPEPQRSLFEAEITRRFIEAGNKSLIVQGKPHLPKHQVLDNITVVNHLDDNQLRKALLQAKKVISRSGYSSIMDFEVLGIQAEYYPTLGQTEQEYLAQLHQSK